MPLSFNGIRVHQGPASADGPGQDLIIGALPAGEVLDRAQVDYVDVTSNPDGYQRPLLQARLRDVASYVGTDEQAVLPTAVLLSVREADSIRFAPKESYGVYELGEVEIADGVPLWVVDGQHRLYGIRAAIEAATEDANQGSPGADETLAKLRAYPLPVSMFEAPEKFIEMRTFFVVNDKQKGVATDVVDELILQHYQKPGSARKLSDKELRRAKATEVVHLLASTPGQPWAGRLLLAGQKASKGTYRMKSHALVVSLEPVLRHNYVRLLPEADAAVLVADFWAALQTLMPEAFDTPEDYTVMKTTGVYAWHMVLPSVIEHLRDKRDFSRKAFVDVLAPARPWVVSQTWHRDSGEPITWGTGLKSLRVLAAQITNSLPQLRLPGQTK
ncbi:MAG: DGQHR domain-containing protein [Actinomycetota bacterium]|nr:DGQHR domain-containing protein [Actinomycetota bacterium]